MVCAPSGSKVVSIDRFQVPEVLLAVLLNGLVPLVNWNSTEFTAVALSITLAWIFWMPLTDAPLAGRMNVTDGLVLSTVNEMLIVSLMLFAESLANTITECNPSGNTVS